LRWPKPVRAVQPQRAAAPIVQDYLLPTLCYAGGPAEIAYFAQVEVVHRKLLDRVTPVVPRIFATLVEARQAKLLDRYQMKLTDIFAGPEQVRELVAAKSLPEGITKSFDLAAEHLDHALAAIGGPLQKLDPRWPKPPTTPDRKCVTSCRASATKRRALKRVRTPKLYGMPMSCLPCSILKKTCRRGASAGFIFC